MNIMGWILLLQIGVNGIPALGPVPYIFSNLADCNTRGEQLVEKYAVKYPVVYSCRYGHVEADNTDGRSAIVDY